MALGANSEPFPVNVGPGQDLPEQNSGDIYPRLAESLSEKSQDPVVDLVPEIVFESEHIRQLIETSIQFAGSSASVLITGESGTGKELFAKLIHTNSNRFGKRFVQVNCAALSENLLESEFFGHVKGAFTGADSPRIGRFAWADGGTLLLDEVSEIPLQLQAKLLRVLEESVFQKGGCNEDQQVDVRVIATSNQDLQKAVAKGTFRNDLFHRLNILQVQIPPLRHRLDDIPSLCKRFIKMYQSESRNGVSGISSDALKLLTSQSWPGNVRQLRNAIHRACVLAKSKNVTSSDFHFAPVMMETIPDWLLDLPMEDVERQMIIANLNRFGGNKTQTAKHLGITARTLHTKVKSYEQDQDRAPA